MICRPKYRFYANNSDQIREIKLECCDNNQGLLTILNSVLSKVSNVHLQTSYLSQKVFSTLTEAEITMLDIYDSFLQYKLEERHLK